MGLRGLCLLLFTVCTLAPLVTQAAPVPEYFDVLGPFPLGVRDTAGDVVDAFGGIQSIHQRFQEHRIQPQLPSELASNGQVNGFKRMFTAVDAGSPSGVHVSLNFSDSVDFSFIEKTAGASAVRYSAWLVGTFSMAASGNVLVRCGGCASFFIGDRRRPMRGDSYNLGYGVSSVWLSQGTHTIYILATAYGSDLNPKTVSLSLLDTNTLVSSWMVLPAEMVIVPVLLDSVLAGPYIGVPVINLSPTVAIGNLSASMMVVGSEQRKEVIVLFDPVVAPGQIAQLVVQVVDPVFDPLYPKLVLTIQSHLQIPDEPLTFNLDLTIVKSDTRDDPSKLSTTPPYMV